jgi:SAM-dependent methyltransferase
MKTDYVGHDRVYQNHRGGGQPGWDSSDARYEEFKVQVERVIARGAAPQSGRLLELGCGAGNMTVWFAGRGYEAHGVDIAPTAIDWAKERARSGNVDVRFVVGDVIRLVNYPESCFDFVFDGHCLHCIVGQDRSTMLANVWRVLKPGGYFMVNTMCGPVDPAKLQHYDPDSRCTFSGDIATRYYGDADALLAEMAAAGFEIVQYDIESGAAGQPGKDLIVEARKGASRGC